MKINVKIIASLVVMAMLALAGSGSVEARKGHGKGGFE